MECSQRLLLFCVTIVWIFASISGKPTLENEWTYWKQKYGKTYKDKHEELNHWKIWLDSYKYVQQHNNRTDTGFIVEMNFLADQINIRSPIQYNNVKTDVPVTKVQDVPDSWDWRVKGAVGPVQNQGMMGDVQTIVITECVESYEFVKKGQLEGLSIFEVHDCCVHSRLEVDNAFKCIHDIGGLCSEASYPKSVGRCANDSCDADVQVMGGETVAQGDEQALKAAVYKIPVMVLVDASHASFQLYRSGIYSEPACSSVRLDHALQIVGYGTMKGVDYWICKNSWGVDWGDRGYILIARNKGNMCGIATHATYPV
ncbi:hypothetical protein ACF0H5_013980 [Mactra antiquata]